MFYKHCYNLKWTSSFVDCLADKILYLWIMILPTSVFAQQQNHIYKNIDSVRPLEAITLAGIKGSYIKVFDGKGREYVSGTVKPATTFLAGGALGKQIVRVYNNDKKLIDSIQFIVDAKTNIDDGGYYKQMFDLFYKGMWVYAPDGEKSVEWNGKNYHFFEPWVLDHYNNMKGLKYFSDKAAEFVDLSQQAQREDGMIWSFVHTEENVDYFFTRDKFSGYTKKIGDRVFTRQPVENHPEYLYVNSIYECWKAVGVDTWMKNKLVSASKALDYALNDPARWSKRFGLLKRVYCIDSWDFAVEDEYLPDLGVTNTMIIDPVKSKFGVFFGDNTGYITACYQLAEMLEHAGNNTDATKYRNRGDELKNRLDKLAWNGHFFTHFIDEDSTVHRNLGVDEKSQIAQSNAYSLNRNITPAQSKAIIETYLQLKNNLPIGSPGEWYAIYPPFQRGFERHDAIWQYMNGGVGGHVAGELARGAYENGYENYGSDILNRLFELGKKYDNRIWFAYTGSIPPPPAPPVFKPLNIAPYANMDNWVKGGDSVLTWMNSKREGDDLRNLPLGEQTFSSIRFNVIDPEKNNRKSVLAVSKQKGFPASIEITVDDTAACIYLLHTSSKPASENVVGAVAFVYEDGSTKTNYMTMNKQLTYWWFSQLKTDYSGIAWYGKNLVSEGVGLSWCAINNPEPKKKISKIILLAPENSGIYTVFGITLADKQHYVPVKVPSYGGPDDWAAATAMAAMVEGLAGVKDMPKTESYSNAIVAPRWITTTADSVNATIRYAASEGYVSYQYRNDKSNKAMQITAAGSGAKMFFHLLLPENAKVKSIVANKKQITFTQSTIEKSSYADFSVELDEVKKIDVTY